MKLKAAFNKIFNNPPTSRPSHRRSGHSSTPTNLHLPTLKLKNSPNQIGSQKLEVLYNKIKEFKTPSPRPSQIVSKTSRRSIFTQSSQYRSRSPKFNEKFNFTESEIKSALEPLKSNEIRVKRVSLINALKSFEPQYYLAFK